MVERLVEGAAVPDAAAAEGQGLRKNVVLDQAREGGARQADVLRGLLAIEPARLDRRLLAWLARAQRLGVDMPITACVVALLEGRLTVREALARLMSRDARPE